MNLKACTFEKLAFISLGFGRGAQVGKTSLLEVEFITAQASTLGVFNFLLGTFQALGKVCESDFVRNGFVFFWLIF